MPGLRGGLGGHPLLIGLRFGDGRFAQRDRPPDGSVALGFGGGDVGIALDARDIRTPHIGDVLVLVANFLDGERDHLQPHLVHVIRAGRSHPVGHHLRLLHDLFHRELADDAAQVTFHHQADQRFPVLRRLGEELLRRSQDGFRIGLHLDLRDRLDGDGNALFGVEVLLRSDIERHQLERELAAGLDHGEDDRAVSLYHAGAAKSVDHQDLIRSRLAIQSGEDADQQHHSSHRCPDHD